MTTFKLVALVIALGYGRWPWVVIFVGVRSNGSGDERWHWIVRVGTCEPVLTCELGHLHRFCGVVCCSCIQWLGESAWQHSSLALGSLSRHNLHLRHFNWFETTSDRRYIVYLWYSGVKHRYGAGGCYYRFCQVDSRHLFLSQFDIRS
jgi:hypothetical protein